MMAGRDCEPDALREHWSKSTLDARNEPSIKLMEATY